MSSFKVFIKYINAERSQPDVWQKMQEVARFSNCFIIRLLGFVLVTKIAFIP